MRFTRHKVQRNDFEIVVTSMLDINFLLIMFFMMTAHFQRETHAQLDLPQETGQEQTPDDEAGLVINVTAGGEIVVSGKTIAFDDLRGLVQTEIAKFPGDSAAALKLMVRADRNSTTGQLNRVIFLLRELGVGTIRIATEIPL